VADHRALVIAEPGTLVLKRVPGLVPGPGEVLIRPVHTGICGTDLELLAGVVDPAYVRYPLTPGHEWSGIVERTGPGVTGLEPGQPVIAEGIIGCRACAPCARGATNLCANYDELGFTRPGAAADQLIVPAHVVHPLAGTATSLPGVAGGVSGAATTSLPGTVGGVAGASSLANAPASRADAPSLLDAALAEPAAVAWRAIGRAHPRPGERIAIVGDGTVALLAVHLLRLYSPAALEVFGQREPQAQLAAAMGATAFHVTAAGHSGVPAAPHIAGAIEPAAGPWLERAAFDIVVEAAGTAAAVEHALALARRGGRVVLLGLAGNNARAAFPVDDVVNGDLTITASFGYTSAAFAEVAALLRSGQICLRPLITHRFPLDKYADAYQTLRSASGPRGKVLLDITASSA
jgi:L-iditol 2-dehydrogenase